MLTQFCH